MSTTEYLSLFGGFIVIMLRSLLEKLGIISFFERLWIADLRTFRIYSIPIQHNAIDGTEFKSLTVPKVTDWPNQHESDGLVVFDPGFRNTAVKASQITYINGIQGILQYRQHPIEYLFQHQDYEDVVYLLAWGSLPDIQQKKAFRARLARYMLPDESVIRTIEAFSPNAPAFLVMAAGLAAWAASDANTIPVYKGESIYDNNTRAIDEGIHRSLAAVTTVVAITYCHQQGKDFVKQVDPEISAIENMLTMMGRVDACGKPNAHEVSVLNKLWILFADHEMTNSTTAFLNATSALSDPLSACVACVASGNGPLHGGAIDLAYKQFKKMGDKGGIHRYMEDVRQKKVRLMGVGHRIYRREDPRLPCLRGLMTQVSSSTSSNPMLETALEIERIVATDTYFTSRKLGINVDLYGSFVYVALGFDDRMFTPLAMTARCAGVLAQWRESMHQPTSLWRPRQIFNGTASSGS